MRSMIVWLLNHCGASTVKAYVCCVFSDFTADDLICVLLLCSHSRDVNACSPHIVFRWFTCCSPYITVVTWPLGSVLIVYEKVVVSSVMNGRAVRRMALCHLGECDVLHMVPAKGQNKCKVNCTTQYSKLSKTKWIEFFKWLSIIKSACDCLFCF